MPEFFVLEFDGEGSLESYHQISKNIGVDHEAKTGYPAGMISHVAAANQDGSHIVISEIWETQAAQEAFMTDRLGPALAAEEDGGAPARAEWFALVTQSAL